MKLLQTKDNVDAPNATYPFGTMRDRALGTPGSKVNTEFMTDYVQFFEKMFAESGLTANGLPDNFTNGFQLWEAFRSLTRPYKVYSAIISQTGTSNPTVTVLQNELGATLTWNRLGAGIYRATLSGAFVTNKTFLFINPEEDTLTSIKNNTTNAVTIETKDLGTVSTDGLLDNTSIEIRIYD